MPETVSGQSAVPSHSDSERTSRDRLARIEAQLEMLARSVAELATWVTERADAEAEAEAILRRAASPDRPRRTPNPQRRGRHRGDTFLTVVKVAAALAACLTIALAAMGQRHLKDQRYTPRSVVHVAHVHSDHDADDR